MTTPRFVSFCLAVFAAAAALMGQSSILSTKHNLSASGPGTIRASAETQVCIFCHTPHNARTQAPLWNREDPGGVYVMYWSATLDAYPSAAAAPQPNGNSKLCLSCHDGSLALGSTVARGEIPMAGGITTMPVGSLSYLGVDLSGHHPISFTVTDALVATNNSKGDVPLKSVAEIKSSTVVELDPADRLQCTSCHDPHSNPYSGFMRSAEPDDACLACHT